MRIRTQWTSLERAVGEYASECRGTPKQRLGTGSLFNVNVTKLGQPCPCHKCKGEVVRKHWEIIVQTAGHVVFNTEEAKETRVDLFYDDEQAEEEGRMKTVWAVKVLWSNVDMDICLLLCVTHDQTLADKIQSITFHWRASLFHIFDTPNDHFFQKVVHLFFDGDHRRNRAMIVSHPHGQPKKITVGKLRYSKNISWYCCKSIEDRMKKPLKYQTPTCPGSSGATVYPFRFSALSLLSDSVMLESFPYRGPVHIESSRKPSLFRKQVNCGNWGYVC